MSCITQSRGSPGPQYEEATQEKWLAHWTLQFNEARTTRPRFFAQAFGWARLHAMLRAAGHGKLECLVSRNGLPIRSMAFLVAAACQSFVAKMSDNNPAAFFFASPYSRTSPTHTGGCPDVLDRQHVAAALANQSRNQLKLSMLLLMHPNSLIMHQCHVFKACHATAMRYENQNHASYSEAVYTPNYRDSAEHRDRSL